MNANTTPMPAALSHSAPFLYPSPPDAAVKLQYVGQRLQDVQAPAIVLDRAIVKRNCQLMLDAADKLGLPLRAHVKTHKTIELSKLQVGEDRQSIRLVASTVSELEHLLPWLLECRSQGKDISVMYGVPLSVSAVPRLATIARTLGPGTVGCFVDHPDHVKILETVNESTWPGKIPVFVVIDVGYRREGAMAESRQLSDIADELAVSARAHLYGLYSHYGSSYSVSNPEEALKDLEHELQGVELGAQAFLKRYEARAAARPSSDRIVLSLGASPTATAVQNLFEGMPQAQRQRDLFDRIGQSFTVELHAGVYPVMDMQQLATHARPAHSSHHPGQSLLTFDDLGMRTLVEVISLYPERATKPEAMVAGGCIVFGREPCKSYDGWGVVSSWPAKSGPVYDPDGSRTGWIVDRVAQEHGVLAWQGPTNELRPLRIGEKLLIWPNHACIAGAGFGWYLVVDSSSSDPDRVVDVWMRWRGW